MNHASGAVAPPDAEVIQAGDAIWQRAERRGLVQGAVWPVRVAEVLVLAQDGHQGALVPGQGPVQQLTPAAADPAFRDRVHSWRLNSGADAPDASGLEDGAGRGGEAGIPVMQGEFHAHPCIFQRGVRPERIARPYRDIPFRAGKSPYKTEIYATLDRGGYVRFRQPRQAVVTCLAVSAARSCCWPYIGAASRLIQRMRHLARTGQGCRCAGRNRRAPAGPRRRAHGRRRRPAEGTLIQRLVNVVLRASSAGAPARPEGLARVSAPVL